MNYYANLSSSEKTLFRNEIKRVNQRLREIEKQGLQNASNWYQYINKMQYDGVKALTLDSKGRVKLRTDIASIKSGKTLAKIRDIVDYTLGQGKYVDKGIIGNTSTISGIQARYKQAFNTFKQNTGYTNVSFDNYIELWKNEQFKALVSAYGYSETMRMLNDAPNIDTEQAIKIMYESKDISEIYTRFYPPEDVETGNAPTEEEFDKMFKHLP